MENIHFFKIGFHRQQVVQDFFHQQYQTRNVSLVFSSCAFLYLEKRINKKKRLKIPSLKLTARTWKWMVGRWLSLWGFPLFSGANWLLVSGRVLSRKLMAGTWKHHPESGETSTQNPYSFRCYFHHARWRPQKVRSGISFWEQSRDESKIIWNYRWFMPFMHSITIFSGLFTYNLGHFYA